MIKVVNEFGIEFNFSAVVDFMDSDICEKLNADFAPCSEQKFFDLYCVEHEKKYGEVFELAKKNPCW